MSSLIQGTHIWGPQGVYINDRVIFQYSVAALKNIGVTECYTSFRRALPHWATWQGSRSALMASIVSRYQFARWRKNYVWHPRLLLQILCVYINNKSQLPDCNAQIKYKLRRCFLKMGIAIKIIKFLVILRCCWNAHSHC